MVFVPQDCYDGQQTLRSHQVCWPSGYEDGILPNQVPLVRETVGIRPLFIHPQAYQSSPLDKLRAIRTPESARTGNAIQVVVCQSSLLFPGVCALPHW